MTTEHRKAKQREYSRLWRERNPEKLAESGKRHREKNADRIKEQQRDHKRRKRAENPEFFKNYHQQYHRKRRQDHKAIALMFVGNAQRRSVEKGLDFDLFEHFDEIVERMSKWRCEMSGVRLESNVGKKAINSISIDRIDAARGYTYDNIRIIAWGLNAAFSDWGQDETIRLVKRMIDRLELI